MKTKTAIELAGSAAALSKLLEITPGAVSQWGEDVPDTLIWQLKVLRPDWFVDNSPWDGVTERRKLNAPVERRVSPESVARANFLLNSKDIGSAGQAA